MLHLQGETIPRISRQRLTTCRQVGGNVCKAQLLPSSYPEDPSNGLWRRVVRYVITNVPPFSTPKMGAVFLREAVNTCTLRYCVVSLARNVLNSPYTRDNNDRPLAVDCVWNVMAHAQKRRHGRVHLNRLGRQLSRLLAAKVCASVVVMLDTPCSEVVWRVLATHSIRQFPLHLPPPPPCVTVCHHISTALYCSTIPTEIK